jgi:hypothetical protein
MRQKGVLLGFVKAMDLIDKQEGSFAMTMALCAGFPSMTPRISFTPARTALSATKWA